MKSIADATPDGVRDSCNDVAHDDAEQQREDAEQEPVGFRGDHVANVVQNRLDDDVLLEPPQQERGNDAKDDADDDIGRLQEIASRVDVATDSVALAADSALRFRVTCGAVSVQIVCETGAMVTGLLCLSADVGVQVVSQASIVGLASPQSLFSRHSCHFCSPYPRLAGALS